MNMDGEKPIIEQMRESVPSGEDVQQSMNEGVQGIQENLTNIKQSISDSINEFSTQTTSEATSDFFNSNSLLAKFAFIILVVIIFMFVLKFMVSILGYFFTPSRNPYLVKGSLGGSQRVVIPQNPANEDSVQIYKSNDRHRGAEYTWSVWLFLTNSDIDSTLHNIFVKGDSNFDVSGVNLLNGPGLYLESKDSSGSTANEYNLHVFMDHNGGEETSGSDSGRDKITIQSMPIRKWVHVAIRLQNKVADIYVNGTIAKRHNMVNAPKQNFNDVTVCGNSGFPGKLSDLRYYSYALNVFELNNIVMFGPNTSPSDLSIDATSKTGNYSYLSNMWYSSKY
jgi:hypothetical protein